MTDTNEATMTECQRMAAVKTESQAIGEFIEWLPTVGLHICEKITKKDCTATSSIFAVRDEWRCVDGRMIYTASAADRGECDTCDGTGFVDRIEPEFWPGLGAAGTIEKLLAQHFGIDLMKVDNEQRALFAQLRGE